MCVKFNTPNSNPDTIYSAAVRVEWAKAKARRDRWTEEVELLREKMRRVLQSLEWRERW